MHRSARAVSFALVAVAVLLGGCRRKPAQTEVQPPTTTPTTTTPTPAPTDPCPPGSACAAAREDSIRNAAARSAATAARAALEAPVYFDYDASDIRSDQRTILEQKAVILAANTAVRIRIEGHTDERGSDEYNVALGQRRAATAKRFLTDRGIDGGRIEIVSFGEERPSAQGGDEAAWARNRRGEFVIVAGRDNIAAPPTAGR